MHLNSKEQMKVLDKNILLNERLSATSKKFTHQKWADEKCPDRSNEHTDCCIENKKCLENEVKNCIQMQLILHKTNRWFLGWRVFYLAKWVFRFRLLWPIVSSNDIFRCNAFAAWPCSHRVFWQCNHNLPHTQ